MDQRSEQDNFATVHSVMSELQAVIGQIPLLSDLRDTLDNIELEQHNLIQSNFKLQKQLAESEAVQEEFRQRELNYNAMIDQFPGGMIGSYDHNLRYKIIGGKGLEAAGLKAEDFQGKRLRDVMPDEIYQRDEPALKSALQGETVEVVVPFMDNFYRVITSPIKNNNEIIGGIVLSQVVTGTILNEQRFSTLFDTASIGMVLANSDGSIALANMKASELFAYSREELSRMNLNQLIPDDLHMRHDEHIASYFSNPRAREMGRGLELLAKRKDGTVFPIEVSLTMLDSEQGTQAVAFIADITDRRQLKQELEEREVLYRTLVETLPDAVMIIRDGIYSYCNMTCVHMTGYDNIDEIVGKPALDFIAPEHHSRAMEIIENPKPLSLSKSIEINILKRDGSVFPAEARAIPIIYRHRESILIVAQDMTERKLAEYRQLELVIEKQKVAVLQQFIQDASHDFRTPISTILSSAHILKKQLDTDSHISRIGKIEKHAKHLQALLDDMFGLLRIELEEKHITSSIKIASYIRTWYSDFQKAGISKNQEMRLIIAEDIPEIRANEVVLRRAISELVSNAVNHNDSDTLITLSLELEADTLLIHVADTGKGIHEEELQHIFKRFYRVDKARGGDSGGTGLGLSMVQVIVEKHGGKIYVQSVPGEGSTFTIALPLE